MKAKRKTQFLLKTLSVCSEQGWGCDRGCSFAHTVLCYSLDHVGPVSITAKSTQKTAVKQNVQVSLIHIFRSRRPIRHLLIFRQTFSFYVDIIILSPRCLYDWGFPMGCAGEGNQFSSQQALSNKTYSNLSLPSSKEEHPKSSHKIRELKRKIKWSEIQTHK